MTTRRRFLAGLAASSIAALAHAERSSLDIGLELYSLRAEMKRDVPGTLARIRKMGFRHVEVPGFYGQAAAEFRRSLDAASLKATAMVAPYDDLKTSLDRVKRDLDTLGARWAILPWIPHGDRFERADAQRAVEDMNAFGAALAKSGFRFAYHPHGYEFYPAPEGTLFDLLAQSTDPAAVKFEMDTFWIVVPGQDCVRLLERYPTRFRLMHLKDLRKGAPTGDLHGTALDTDSVPVGVGIVPWDAVLALARKQGCEAYYIEDESPDAAKQIPLSLSYLKLHA
jgi:sugar phosphate isomerase/epimerase